MFRIKCRLLFFLLFVVGISSSAQTSNKNGILHKQVVRIIDLAPKQDSIIHHLKDENDDSSLFQVIVSAIRSGRLNVYAGDDNHFKDKLSYEALNKRIGDRPDTQTIIDPVTNTEVDKVIPRNFDFFGSPNKYKVLEDWAFDELTGKTQIQIVGIGPVWQYTVAGPTEEQNYDIAYPDRDPMFWLRYNDLSSIIARYEQYHPDNTIAQHIWNDYFLNDVKPKKIK